MKVTKNMAHHVATKMLEDREFEINNLCDELRKKGYELALSKIPKKILELWEDKKIGDKWFNLTNRVDVTGPGLQYQSIYYPEDKHLPSNSENYSYAIEISATEAKEVVDLSNKIDKLRKQYRNLFDEIEQALISLGSTKKVADHFKEAIQFFELKSDLLPVVNIERIRKKLKKAD